MFINELKRQWRYMEEDEGGGGTPPDPSIETPPEPPANEEPVIDEDAELQKSMDKSAADYRKRLTDIGGKFDEAGTFLGFDVPNSQPSNGQSNTNNDSYIDPDLQTQLTGLKQDIISEFRPERIDGGFSRVLAENPGLKRYEREARSAMDKMQPDQINDQTILSTLYFMRGQGADLEINEARVAERKKTSTKIDAGGVAGSSQGGGSSAGGNITVEPATAEYAKAWKLDPIAVQKKLNDRRKGVK